MKPMGLCYNLESQKQTSFMISLLQFLGGVVNLYKNQGNLHIHDSGKKEIQIKREKIYTNSDGCRDIHFGK